RVVAGQPLLHGTTSGRCEESRLDSRSYTGRPPGGAKSRGWTAAPTQPLLYSRARNGRGAAPAGLGGVCRVPENTGVSARIPADMSATNVLEEPRLPAGRQAAS